MQQLHLKHSFSLRKALSRDIRQSQCFVFVADSPYWSELRPFLSAKIISARTIDDLRQHNETAVIVIDLDLIYSAEMIDYLTLQAANGVSIVSAMTLFESLSGQMAFHVLQKDAEKKNFTAVYTTFSSMQSLYLKLRRVADVFVILLLSPIILCLVLVVASLIAINMGGPVFFLQKRIGRHNKVFTMFKFRTMQQNKFSANQAKFATQESQRITPLGAFLRKYRLDELPQLWNVLRGEMCIIGPRPEQEAMVALYNKTIPSYSLRHSLCPGITGWAQVTQGYAATSSETKTKLLYDAYYIKHLSPSLDIKIILKTIQTILTGFGSK